MASKWWASLTREQKDAYNLKRRERWASDPEHRERHKQQMIKVNQRATDTRRQKNLDKYGIEEGHSCAICKSTDPKNGRGQGRFQIDHDHNTGLFRGFLCKPCNVGIGALQDDPRLLDLASQYLQESYGEQYLRLELGGLNAKA